MLTSEKPLCSFVQLGGYQTQAEGRVPRARVGAGHGAGRLRELPGDGRGTHGRPEAPGGDAAALQRPLLRRPAVREGRGLLPGPEGGLRADRARAAPARARQRHRGRQDGVRQGHGVEALLPVPGALPLREPLLQPLLREREGVGGERRGLPAPQPPRPGPRGGLAGRAQREARVRLRPHQRRSEEQGGQEDRGGAPGGSRGHAGAARHAVRRGQVGARARRQARVRASGRQPILRRPRMARPRAAGGRARPHRGGAR